MASKMAEADWAPLTEEEPQANYPDPKCPADSLVLYSHIITDKSDWMLV